MPRLTLFLGGGGVGKTTLSAALALAQARSGRQVGLLSIDPARRLRSALHLEVLDDEGVQVEPNLRASLLEPEVALRRWAAQACPEDAERLIADPFFLALADRIAAATDAIAAARAAEWAERDPDLDELIIDTAPGVAGIELLARPEKLLALLEGRLIRWLRNAGRGGRVLGGLTRIAGLDTLERLGRFLTSMDQGLRQLSQRLQQARRWLRQANVVVVASVSSASVAAAEDIGRAARGLGLQPRLAILNRALPPSLCASTDPAAQPFFAYVDRYRGLQQRVAAALAASFPELLRLPESARTDLDGLAELGNLIKRATAESK